MKLTRSKDCNPNYLAKIVQIDSFRPHPNAERLKLATVDGYIISTSIDSAEGIYVYFPVECVINSDFLKVNNLYRKADLNLDPTKQGFFEESGRVKCIKLRGLASEGLIMPIYELCKFAGEGIAEPINGSAKEKKKVLNIVDDQFHFHIDTEQLQKNIHKVQPTDIINISWKEHGTSLILCNLLTKKNLSLKEKIAKFFGVPVSESEYKKFCSSRKVIKNPELNPGMTKGYYDCDIWNLAFEVLKDYLSKGLSIYAEIVGYMPTGSMIQSGYDYQCIYDPKTYEYSKMTPKQMYDAKLFDIIVYRITYTNVEGRVFEFSTQQMKTFCEKYGIHCIKELYYGTAQQLFPELNPNEHWHENFLQALRDKYLERESVLCNNKVPEEGIVLRREVSEIDVYKLKSVAFLERETKMLDKGEADIESGQE